MINQFVETSRLAVGRSTTMAGGIDDESAEGEVLQKAVGPRKAGIRSKEDKAKHPKGYWSERCPHNRTRRVCRDCGGTGLCEHGRQKSICKMCGGKSICEHNRRRNRCKTCGGSSICPHNKHRPFCKDCGGSQICEHGRHKNRCVECGGSGICVHKRHKYRCWECKEAAQCMHKQLRKTCDECRLLREAGPESMALKIHEALSEFEKEGLLPEQLLPDGDPRKQSLSEILKSLRTVALAFVPAPRPAPPQPKDAHNRSIQEDTEMLLGRDTRHIQQRFATQMYFAREHMALHLRHLHYNPEAAAGCIEGLPKHLSAMQRQHDTQVAFFGGKSKEAAVAGPEAPPVLNADKEVASPQAEGPGQVKTAGSADAALHLRPASKSFAVSGDASSSWMREASPGASSSWTGAGNPGWSPGGWAGGWGCSSVQSASQLSGWPGAGLGFSETGASRHEGTWRQGSNKKKKAAAGASTTDASHQEAQVAIPFAPSHPAQGYPFGPPPDLHWTCSPHPGFPPPTRTPHTIHPPALAGRACSASSFQNIGVFLSL